MMVVTTAAIIRANSGQIVTVNKPTQLFTGRIPFLSPKQCRSTEGKLTGKTCLPEMSYLVSTGTLSPTHSRNNAVAVCG